MMSLTIAPDDLDGPCPRVSKMTPYMGSVYRA